MNYSVITLILTGLAFLIYGIAIKNTRLFIGFYNTKKYPRNVMFKVQRISSFVTSITAFIFAYLVYQGLLQKEFFMLIVVIWGMLNMILLKAYSKKDMHVNNY